MLKEFLNIGVSIKNLSEKYPKYIQSFFESYLKNVNWIELKLFEEVISVEETIVQHVIWKIVMSFICE